MALVKRSTWCAEKNGSSFYLYGGNPGFPGLPRLSQEDLAERPADANTDGRFDSS
jgi:hypothetical protein